MTHVNVTPLDLAKEALAEKRARIAELEAENAALKQERDELREWKRLAQNDSLVRRIHEVCEKHCDDSLNQPPYTQIWRIEQCLDGQEMALNDWHTFFEFAANGATALSVIERFEAWKAAKNKSPVSKADLAKGASQ